MKATVDTLIELAARHFKVDAGKLRPDDDLFEALGANSFEAVELISELEDHFEVELPDYELQGVKTFAALAAKIDKRR